MTRLARLALSLFALVALLLARPATATASTRAALDACTALVPLADLSVAASAPVSPGCAQRSPSSASASTAKGETDGAQRAPAREHRRVGAPNHPDHLGSTSYVTDAAGDVYEHTGYFPHGETWIDQANSSEALPYLFTGKELDQETGLYYFGARYYDPQTALWQSADPALAEFLDTSRGLSVLQPKTLSLYSYSFQQPISLRDPDGRAPIGEGPHELWKHAAAARVSGDHLSRADLAAIRSSEQTGVTISAIIIVSAVGAEGIAATLSIEAQVALTNAVAALTEGMTLPSLTPAVAGAGAGAAVASNSSAGKSLVSKLGGFADDAVAAGKQALQSLTTGGGGGKGPATGVVAKTASGKRVGDFTRAQRAAAKAENAARNGGQMACTDCGTALQNIGSQKGVRTPSNQAQVHHDPPIVEGGGRHSSAVVVCPECHADRHTK